MAAPAAAEEARWNAHLEAGPVFVVTQPDRATTDQELRTAGMHLRVTGEFEPHERFGFELAYGVDAVFLRGPGSTPAQQTVALGAKFRPWWNREPGWVLNRPKDRKIGFITDVLSDFWIDAHAGGSFADRTRLTYDVGIGTRMPLVSPLQIGTFVRFQHLIGLGASDGSYMLISFGLTFSVGFGSVRGDPDEDRDGVSDARDRCPGTARSASVNDVGCEMKPEAPTPGGGKYQCSDSDLDGVCDGADECPDTRMGTKVEKNGCPPEPAAPKEDEPAEEEKKPDEKSE